MAFIRNLKKTSKVVGALNRMKSGFLSKPEIRTLFGRETTIVSINYRGKKPVHTNSILGMGSQPVISHSCPVTNRNAQFHHLAENSFLAWATTMSNRQPDLTLKFTGPESMSGMRNYAKDVDNKESPSISEKKDPGFMKTEDSASAARFAEAKRILKEKRMSKEQDYQKISPFEEP